MGQIVRQKLKDLVKVDTIEEALELVKRDDKSIYTTPNGDIVTAFGSINVGNMQELPTRHKTIAGALRELYYEIMNTPPTNEIWYTSNDGNIIEPNNPEYVLGVNVISNTYKDGKGVIECDGDITKIAGQFAYNSIEAAKLTSIRLPQSITSVTYIAFYGCNNLPKTDGIIYADYVCVGGVDTHIDDINIKEGTKFVLGIRSSTIGDVVNSLTIPQSVIDIYENAFSHIKVFKSNFINNSVLDEEENNYWGAVVITNNEIWYEASAKLLETTSASSQGLHTNAFNTTIQAHTFENGKGKIVFADSVTNIGYSAFYTCTGLSSVNIPDSVTNIGDSAFCRCGLSSIIIPNSVTNIEPWAFRGCSSLTSITIGNNVENIGIRAFMECPNLTSVIIPSSVESIGNGAFAANFDTTSALSEFIYNGTMAQFKLIAPETNTAMLYGAPVSYIQCTDGNLDASPYKQSMC